MPKRGTRPDSLKGLIESALSYAKMERANFGGIGLVEPIVLRTPEEVDAFIKEQTRLYRQSWIIHPLEKALAKVSK